MASPEDLSMVRPRRASIDGVGSTGAAMSCHSGEFFDWTEKNRLFILGAGFSVGAGLPLTQELFVGAMSLLREDGLYERVKKYAELCFQRTIRDPADLQELSLAALCSFIEFVDVREYFAGERWSDAGCKEKLALRFYLAKELARHTPPADSFPELYRSFARQLHSGDIVLTFNWDFLLELALRSENRPYSYDFGDDSVWLCKMHGSANWRMGKPSSPPRPHLKWTWLRRLTSGLVKSKLYYTDQLLNYSAWQNEQCLGEIEPHLVLPGYGKAFDVRPLTGLWYKPEWVFGLTNQIYLIGVGLAPDDHLVDSLLRHGFAHVKESRQIMAVNPCPKALDKLSELIGPRFVNVDLLSEEFGPAHVDRMANANPGI